MVIDVHTHIDDEKTYQSYMRKAKGRVGLAFVMHYCKDDLRKTAKYVASKKNLRLLAGVDINAPEKIKIQLKTIESMFKKGEIVGVKLYPGYQYFSANDSRVWPVAELCLKYNKPLAFHSGDVSDSRALLRFANPLYVDDIAVRYPDLKIVICHFGFPFMYECASVVSKNKNVYADISGTIDAGASKKETKLLYLEYKKDLAKIMAYFPEIKKKIMFGTDYGGENVPLDEIELYIKLIKQIFPKENWANAFGGLAKKVFLE
ncbi:MAG: amidohydrolase 2 [Parcubacteria group bacterium Licking1014_17]|nr:MAG: amidohydrolase 2 [Parcubacteria group bacterium Licking1014_17]